MSKDEIRNEILSLEDLGEMVPFFKTGVGKGLGRWLMRILGVNSINQINSDLCHLQGPDYASAALRHHLVDVEYKIHGEENLDLMRQGQFLTVSNHPFGGIDGLILVDIVGHIRPDYKVLVNSVLSHISSLEEMWVPVVPNRQSSRRYVHDPSVNVKSLRALAREFQAGYPFGLFPAGGVGHFSLRRGLPVENPWKNSSLRILRRADRPIFPIMFDGHNSWLFYYMKNHISIVSDLMLPSEILNKKGEIIDVYVGAPIMPDETAHLTDLKSYGAYLIQRSMRLLPRAMYQPQVGAKAVLVDRSV